MAFLDFLPIIGGVAQNIWNATVGPHQSKDLMRYQYELNQMAIENQNRYNSPVAQMERLRAAGLNPNLVYGNGVDGNQGGAATVGIANRNPNGGDFGFADVVSNVFRRRQLENETRLAAANEQQILANKQLSQARYLDVMQDVARKDATFGIFVRKAKADLEHTQQSIEESRQRVNESHQRVSNMQSQANLLNEQIKYWEKHAENEGTTVPELMRARIHELESKNALNRANIGVANSLVKLNDQKLNNLIEELTSLTLENGSKAIEFKLKKLMDENGLTGMKPQDFLKLLVTLIGKL